MKSDNFPTQAQQELADMRADLAAAETPADFEALFWGFCCEDVAPMPSTPDAIRKAVIDYIDQFARDVGLA